MFNYKYHIFCCINERPKDDPKGCCKGKGSEEILDYLKKTVHEKGLKKEVRVTATKCLGACPHGPAIVVYPEGVWYTVSTVDDAVEIIEGHILKRKPISRLQMRK
jgi:(2Fe-2S) ferredoxin